MGVSHFDTSHFIQKDNMITIDVYNFEVISGTRNHKGSFVQATVYKLVEIDQSGWALICRDQAQASCHYVDPDCLREIPNQDTHSCILPNSGLFD